MNIHQPRPLIERGCVRSILKLGVYVCVLYLGVCVSVLVVLPKRRIKIKVNKKNDFKFLNHDFKIIKFPTLIPLLNTQYTS